jgi:hypothetical protein
MLFFFLYFKIIFAIGRNWAFQFISNSCPNFNPNLVPNLDNFQVCQITTEVGAWVCKLNSGALLDASISDEGSSFISNFWPNLDGFCQIAAEVGA